MADACYQKRFYTASFKGFEFEAEDASSEHGRRGAEGQFPFGENTAYADLGRHIRTYHIKARFVTNDHVRLSNQFARVCESKGPGTLVHPTRGALRAACKKAKFHDKILDGYGITEVELEFVEAQDWLGSAVGLSIGGLDISTVVSAVSAVFDTRYLLTSVPINQQGAVVAIATNGISAIKTAFDGATGISTDSNVWRVSEDLDTVARGDRARKPATAWAAVNNGIAAINRYGTDSVKTIDAQRSVVNWATVASTVGSTGYALQAQDTVISTMRILAGVNLAKVAASSIASTSQEACRQYVMVLTVLREESAAARDRCDDDLHLALNDFIVIAQTAMLARVYGAPPIISYDFGGPVWSMVAAHEIYGDARKFADIETVNAGTFPWNLGPSVSAISPR